MIYRQNAIDAVKKNTFRLTFAEEQNCEGHVAWSARAVYSDVMEGALLELPSAQPDNQINLCDSCDYSFPDCPSKNDDVIFGNGIGNDNICACNKYKPTVQPEPKRGEWLTHYDALTGNMEVKCSFCHTKSNIDPNLLMDSRTRVELFKYCPCCGAKMDGDKE